MLTLVGERDEESARESVTWNGQTLHFARPTLKTKAAFKEELERESLAALRRKRDMMSPVEYAEAICSLSRDWNARIYAWGKPAWAQCMLDTEWYKRMLWHVLVQAVLPEKQSLNPGLTPDQMDKLWADLSYPAQDGKPAGNRLDDAYTRLMTTNDATASTAAG